uniref:Uncharacterized protein n=1 Tax=Arundo donax TaxID=35708 RepID=A0A0A9BES5_ARUDO
MEHIVPSIRAGHGTTPWHDSIYRMTN